MSLVSFDYAAAVPYLRLAEGRSVVRSSVRPSVRPSVCPQILDANETSSFEIRGQRSLSHCVNGRRGSSGAVVFSCCAELHFRKAATRALVVSGEVSSATSTNSDFGFGRDGRGKEERQHYVGNIFILSSF